MSFKIDKTKYLIPPQYCDDNNRHLAKNLPNRRHTSLT